MKNLLHALRTSLLVVGVLTATPLAAQIVTTTTITSDSPDPSTAGQAITINFTVTATSGTPTGTVSVTDSGGAVPCIAVPVTTGTCNMTLTSAGAHTLTATYAASGTFNGSFDTESHGVSVTILTNTFVDDLTAANGTCSLREAIRAANTNVPVDACPAGSATIVDVITLATGTYNLTISGTDDTAIAGDLDITGDTRITGALPGPSNTFISGLSSDRVFHVLSGNVQMDNLTVKSGRHRTGGGILNAGMLTLNIVAVSGNSARTSGGGTSDGGGIYNTGTLTLNNSTIINNTAASGASGICRGGGIHNSGGTLTLNNSTVTGNTAVCGAYGTSQGGGIFTGNGGLTTLNSTTPSGNTVTAGPGGSSAGPNTYP